MSLDPLTAILDIGKSAIDKIWPDPVKQAEELRKLEELAQAGDLAALNAEVKLLTGQLEVNKIEASHASIFVAGWRPFIGWVCGTALLYAAILEPLITWIATVAGVTTTLPAVDTTITMQVLLGMLGLGGARTYEKLKGVSRNNKNK